MRLLIDYSAAMNQGAGIGRYARGVVPVALAELASLPVIETQLFFASDQRGPARFERAALKTLPSRVATGMRRAPLSRKRLDQLWHRAGVSVGAKLLCGPAEVVYSPDFFTPPL